MLDRELSQFKTELASRLRAQDREEQDYRRWLARSEDAAHRLSETLSEGSTGGGVRTAVMGIDASNAAAEAALQRRASYDEPIAAARAAVTAAHQRVAALEKLQTRLAGEERRQRGRLEQRKLDEVATHIPNGRAR